MINSIAEDLKCLVGLNKYDERFNAIIKILYDLSSEKTSIIIREPIEEDVKNGEIVYFCNYEFLELGICIHIDFDFVSEVLFYGKYDLYGNINLPFKEPIFGIDLTKNLKRSEVRFVMGNPIKEDALSDIYDFDAKNKFYVQVGYCGQKYDVLSYIRLPYKLKRQIV